MENRFDDRGGLGGEQDGSLPAEKELDEFSGPGTISLSALTRLFSEGDAICARIKASASTIDNTEWFNAGKLLDEVAAESGKPAHQIDLGSPEFESLVLKIAESIRKHYLDSNGNKSHQLHPAVASYLFGNRNSVEDSSPRDNCRKKIVSDEAHVLAEVTIRGTRKIRRLEAETARLTVGSRVIEAICTEKIALDLNNHFKGDESLLREALSSINITSSLSADDAWELKTALDEGRELDRYLLIGSPLLGEIYCPCCSSTVTLECNGKMARISKPCRYPLGLYPLTTHLNVPSGRLVFANDLRHWFSPEFQKSSARGDLWAVEISMSSARQGLIQGYVGNTCPSIFRVTPQKITISAEPEEEEYDDDEAYFEAPAGERVGQIVTDLWWWSAADYNELKKKFDGSDDEFEEFLKSACIVVNVTPGNYKVIDRPMGWVDDYQGASSFHFATLEHVGPAEPPKLPEEVRAPNFTAGQVILNSILSFPDLYLPRLRTVTPPAQIPSDTNFSSRLSARRLKSFEFSSFSSLIDQTERNELTKEELIEQWSEMDSGARQKAIAKVADHLLCVIGNGANVSEQGWIGGESSMNEDDPDIEISPFTIPFEWQEVHIGYSKIACAAGLCAQENVPGENHEEDGATSTETQPVYLNQSFRQLAYFVLKNMVEFERDSSAGKKNANFAKAALKRFNEIYPGEFE